MSGPGPDEVFGPGSAPEEAAPPAEDETVAPDAGATVEEAAAGEAAAAGDETAALRAERDEFLDHLRRVQADFENFKKRTARQQAEWAERASEGLVAKLLPVLDTLDLAAAHADSMGEAGKAVASIASSLNDVLNREGLERVDPTGKPFDPEEAEAVMHEPADEGQAAPVVAETMRAGYRWRGRVLRAAMVKVKG